MLSQLDLEDVEALYLGPSFLTADPMGPLLDQDEEEALSPSSSLEGKVPASLPLSFTSYQSFLSSSSPRSPRPASPLGTKAGMVSLSTLPWLDADLLGAHVPADDCKDDAFAGMDWMSEKIDLSDFDLDSLMGSCSPDQAPSSPETLLLDPHMELELELELLPPPPSPPPPLAQESPEMATEMKSEPASPPPLSPPSPPSPPLLTLELGSEVDVSVAEKPPATTTTTAPLPTPPHSDSDSDSGIESSASSPARAPSPPASASSSSSRTKPYSKPAPAPAGAKPPRVKSGAPRVAERKIKKMEQNKTAATRYRQKKRVEQEQLNDECQELERRNRQLADRADSISREIQYLRDLMEEVRKHRRGRGAPQEDPATARP